MAEHVAVTPSPCMKLQIWRAPFKVKIPALCNLRFKKEQRLTDFSYLLTFSFILSKTTLLPFSAFNISPNYVCFVFFSLVYLV